MKLTITRTLIVGGAVLALGIGGGVAIADVPASTDGTITACMLKPGGTIRLIDAEAGAACKKSETKVEWNQAGQPGTNGVDGVSGYEVVSKEIDETADFISVAINLDVECPEGKAALGGSTRLVLFPNGGSGGSLVDGTAASPEFDPATNTGGWSFIVTAPGTDLLAVGDRIVGEIFVTCATVLP